MQRSGHRHQPGMRDPECSGTACSRSAQRPALRRLLLILPLGFSSSWDIQTAGSRKIFPRAVYQRSNRFPTQAAPPVTPAIAIEYQVATNNGLSSGQVRAYSNEPTPPATNPAVAPATI